MAIILINKCELKVYFKIKQEFFLQIIKVSQNNIQTYFNLAQGYEAEFSYITSKKPNELGVFELDTHLDESTIFYILTIENTPAGMAAIKISEAFVYEMCEFYVVPYFRKNAVGKRFAHKIWALYPGKWEIKQIIGAEYATIFWGKTITEFKNTPYVQESYLDAYWGQVTRQQFVINKAGSDHAKTY